jgi:HEAT repeat protein
VKDVSFAHATMKTDIDIQVASAKALGAIGDDQALGPLKTIRDNAKNADVRKAAQDALQVFEN